MAKIVKSMRVPPELWERVEAYATDQSLKVNAAVESLLARGLAAGTEPIKVGPKAVLARAEAAAAHLAHPKSKRSWKLPKVQVGPSDVPPGSRLKGGGLHPRGR